MDTFRMITLAAGFISIVIAMFETIYPSEKYEKQMRLIFSLVLVICLVTPFANGEISLSDFSESIDVSSDVIYSNEDRTYQYFENSIASNISTELGKYLIEKEISFEEIKTSINISESGSISINEIEIAVSDTAREDEIIALVKDKIGEDTSVRIKENPEYEMAGIN